MVALPLVKNSPMMKLHELLDLKDISHKLKGLYKRETSHASGPEPYAPLSMFKLMLLGQCHSLSETQCEHALKVLLDFMAFTGFEPDHGSFPDATTICRFRYLLVTAKLDQVFLPRVSL
jgi:IS5 family transposase